MPDRVRITHLPSQTIIAEGALSWKEIMPFEGNYYIHANCLKTNDLHRSGIPGFCFYKFLYVWLDLHAAKRVYRQVGWKYVMPNPLLPFIWFRVAVAKDSQDLWIEPIA